MGRLEELRINAYLSEVARGYSNNSFIAESLFPVINSDLEKVDIFEFNKEAFQVYDTERAIRANSNVISPKGFKKHTTTLYGQINMTANKNQNYQNSNITHKNTTYANITLDAWQDHIKDQINTMKTNGYDGLYIRGFNLYEYSHKDMNTYNVMMHFLEYAHKLDMKVIIQDGHIFIDDFITHKENKDLITGVLREDVYTKYNKKNRTLGQDKKVSDEKKAFLDRVVDYGMKAYIVEYTKASDWKAVIEHDAKKRGYNYIIIKHHNKTKK